MTEKEQSKFQMSEEEFLAVTYDMFWYIGELEARIDRYEQPWWRRLRDWLLEHLGIEQRYDEAPPERTPGAQWVVDAHLNIGEEIGGQAPPDADQ